MQNTLLPVEIEALNQAFPKGVVAIDLETTGLSPLVDRIIEISLIKLSTSGLEIFTSFVDPEREITSESTAIHGIDDEMVKNAPKTDMALNQYLNFVGDLPIVAHNAKFDLGFLIFNLHRYKLPFGHNSIYCSCQLSRKAFPESENYKLSTLAQDLTLGLIDHHRAQADALACLRLMGQILIKTPKVEALFHTQDFAKKSNFDIPKNLEGLSKKVKQAHFIEIRYRGGSYKNEWRPVQCTSLLPLPHGNVLYAKCLHTQIYKSFLLHRILEWREMSLERINEYHKESK